LAAKPRKKMSTKPDPAAKGTSKFPAGLDQGLRNLSIEDLEKRMESKFKKMLAESEEFYDEDDVGSESGKLMEVDKEEPKESLATKFRLRPVVTAPVERITAEKPNRKASANSTHLVKQPKTNVKDETITKKKQKILTPIPLDPTTIDSSKVISLQRLGYSDEKDGIPSFVECGITDPLIISNLRNMGILCPTSVQANAIRAILEGEDVVVKAHTGSGKTLAFLLPLIAKLNTSTDHVQAVVTAPSRELCAQIHTVLSQVSKGTALRTQLLIGGANIVRQTDNLKANKPHIVVGTPGRLGELAFGSKRLRLGFVRYLVMDEIDMLLKPVFQEETKQFVEALPSQKQVIFASATGDSPLAQVAKEELMKNGRLIGGRSSEGIKGSAEALPSNLAHTFVVLQESKRLDALRRFMHTEPLPESALVFVNEQRKVDIIVEKLYELGIIAAPLHGEASKEDRQDVIRRLQDGRLAMLVCTELAARGLDIPLLAHVVNYDLPTNAEHYVHRAGRCGRAGNPGIVVSFTTPKTTSVLEKFSRQLGVSFQEIEIKHARLLIKEKSQPISSDQ